MANYPTQAAIAAILSEIGQNKKKRAMENTLDEARRKGYDIEIVIDPETGKQATKLHYKGKSQSEMVKDQFDVAKMIAEIQKLKRGEETAQKGEEFNWLADLGFGGGAQRLSREGTSGQIKPEIKRALEMRNKFRGTGQTLLPTEKGWTRSRLPKTAPYGNMTPLGRDKILGVLRAGGQFKTMSGDLVDLTTQEGAAKFVQMSGYTGFAKDPEIIAELNKLPSEQEQFTPKSKNLPKFNPKTQKLQQNKKTGEYRVIPK